jgi:hypothetical protein
MRGAMRAEKMIHLITLRDNHRQITLFAPAGHP